MVANARDELIIEPKNVKWFEFRKMKKKFRIWKNNNLSYFQIQQSWEIWDIINMLWKKLINV